MLFCVCLCVLLALRPSVCLQWRRYLRCLENSYPRAPVSPAAAMIRPGSKTQPATVCCAVPSFSSPRIGTCLLAQPPPAAPADWDVDWKCYVLEVGPPVPLSALVVGIHYTKGRRIPQSCSGNIAGRLCS